VLKLGYRNGPTPTARDSLPSEGRYNELPSPGTAAVHAHATSLPSVSCKGFAESTATVSREHAHHAPSTHPPSPWLRAKGLAESCATQHIAHFSLPAPLHCRKLPPRTPDALLAAQPVSQQLLSYPCMILPSSAHYFAHFTVLKYY